MWIRTATGMIDIEIVLAGRRIFGVNLPDCAFPARIKADKRCSFQKKWGQSGDKMTTGIDIKEITSQR